MSGIVSDHRNIARSPAADEGGGGSGVSPQAVEAFYRGNELRESDKGAAIEQYSEAIRIEPNLAEAYFNRGLTYAETGRDDEARADLQALSQRGSALADQLASLLAAHAGSCLSMGSNKVEDGDYEEALLCYERALVYTPDDPDVHTCLGVAYAGLERIEDAIAAYQTAIELNAETAFAFFNRGALHLKRGAFEEAIADFTEAIRLDAHDAESYEMRAQAYESAGDTAAAQADHEQARRIIAEDAAWEEDDGN